MVMMDMVVVVSIPGVIHVLKTAPPVTVLILVGIIIRPAQLHRLVLVHLGSVHYGKFLFGYASIHLNQVEHGDDVCCYHKLLGLGILHGAAHLVLEECGWKGGVQTGRVEEQAAELGQVHQVKTSTQGLTQVLVGHSVVLGIQLLQDPNQKEGVLWVGVHGYGWQEEAYREGLTSGEAWNLETTHLNVHSMLFFLDRTQTHQKI